MNNTQNNQLNRLSIDISKVTLGYDLMAQDIYLLREEMQDLAGKVRDLRRDQDRSYYQ